MPEQGGIGVEITNAELGLVIYNNTSANTATYALSASATMTLVVPSGVDFGLTGTMTLAVNNTGATVNQVITTPDSSVTVNFTSATNVESITGSLTLTVGPAGSPLFTLTGDFGVSEATATIAGEQYNELLIGATNIGGSGLTPSGSSSPVNIENGTLGLVLFSDTNGDSEGYALTASATVVANAGSVGASATLQIERNTSTIEANVQVPAGPTNVKVAFGAGQTATGAVPNLTPYEAITLLNASLAIYYPDGNPLLQINDGGTTTNTSVPAGVTETDLTNVSITLLTDATQGYYLVFN